MAFLARIEAMVAEAKKRAFNERMNIAREDQKRLDELSMGHDHSVHAYLGSMGCDYVLYAVECARSRIARTVAARVRS